MINSKLGNVLVKWLILFVVGIAVFYPTLDAPWHYDDLHLLQRFPSSFLKASWFSNWDRDNVENAGFRPLSPLFNQIGRAHV